jgi:uncharacterized protein YunC (DUF1805 family)
MRGPLVHRLGISAREHRGDADVLGVPICCQERLLGRLLEAVLDQEVEIVALVEHLALHVRVQLVEPTSLAVLLGDQLLIEGGYLDVEIERRQVEVGRETLRWVAVAVPLDVEGCRFVLPRDLIEVQQLGELTFTVMSETDTLVWKGDGLVGGTVRAFWDG